MIKYLSQLYHENHKLELLEVAYLIITITSFLLAAIIALFNQPLGAGILIVPLIALTTFGINLVTWAIVKFIAEEGEKRLGKKTSPADEVKETKETKKAEKGTEPEKTAKSEKLTKKSTK